MSVVRFRRFGIANIKDVLASCLWHDVCVKKAELVLESKPDDGFLKARCSACPNVRFSLTGDTLSQKTRSRRIFDIHFNQVHAERGSAK